MNISEHLQLSVVGFSTKRVGYALAFASFALVPAHFYVSCEASGAIASIGAMLFLVAGVLSFLSPRGTVNRFRPLEFAFIAIVVHMLSAH